MRVKKVSGGIDVTQDVSPHLEWAKYMRENTKTQAQFRKRADTGFKPFCAIPDSVALDILSKYHINIHSANCTKDDLKVVKSIIKRDYPQLMYFH
uniref:Uncharacterized protein n=1 Tax=Virus NIOZ-UU157 TaxID=2763269 RepID=A0A7S9SUW8_9VIRU|nr:MAG: hypothetical protein NIOZUU157_00375 [Virus NIOZ-UU157]